MCIKTKSILNHHYSKFNKNFKKAILMCWEHPWYLIITKKLKASLSLMNQYHWLIKNFNRPINLNKSYFLILNINLHPNTYKMYLQIQFCWIFRILINKAIIKQMRLVLCNKISLLYYPSKQFPLLLHSFFKNQLYSLLFRNKIIVIINFLTLIY